MLAFALQFVVWGFAGLLAAGTLIPLSPSRVWWVRIWDFPRLHVAGGFALLLPLSLLLSGWGAFILGALGLGAQFGVLMPFSRIHEAEADRIGLIVMARACYDPRAAIDMWGNMARGAGDGPPEFLSTHPSHGSRIEALRGWMDEALAARADAGCPALPAASAEIGRF